MTNSNVTRRNVLLGASAVAGATLLPGCSGDSSNDPAKVDKNVAPLELAPEAEGHLYPEGYVGPKARQFKPFSDGSKTYRIVVSQDPTNVGDWNKNSMTAWFEKATGMKVKFDAVLTQAADGSQDLTKINAMSLRVTCPTPSSGSTSPRPRSACTASRASSCRWTT